MHVAEIQAALKKAGYGQADIARLCGVSRAAVGDVVHGRSRSQQIEESVSQATGIPLTELWPQWYDQSMARRAELVSREEFLLLRSFRALSLEQRRNVVSLVQNLELGYNQGSSDSGVTSESRGITSNAPNARIAGRDYNEHGGKSRKP